MKISQVAAVTGSAAAVLAIGVGIALAGQPHKPAPVRQQTVQVGDAVTASASVSTSSAVVKPAVKVARPAVVAPKVQPSSEEATTPVQEPPVTEPTPVLITQGPGTTDAGGVLRPPPLPINIIPTKSDVNPAPAPEPGPGVGDPAPTPSG